jgi:hypothetical protein
VSVHQPEAQLLLGREVYAPTLLAFRASAFDGCIVAVERGIPLDLFAVQADRARQRGGHQCVWVVGAKTGCVGVKCDINSMDTDRQLSKPPGARTPRVGGVGMRPPARCQDPRGGTGCPVSAVRPRYVASAANRVIGRLPHRLRVAKSSRRGR